LAHRAADKDFLAPGVGRVDVRTTARHPKYSRTILAALAAQCTKATFSCLAKWPKFRAPRQRDAALGHTIGTPLTWSHPNLKRLSDEQGALTDRKARSPSSRRRGATDRALLPGIRNLSENEAAIAYLQSRNVAQFAIDVDSFDWRTRSPQSVIARVMAGLERRGRGIVLFHDIHGIHCGGAASAPRHAQGEGLSRSSICDRRLRSKLWPSIRRPQKWQRTKQSRERTCPYGVPDRG